MYIIIVLTLWQNTELIKTVEDLRHQLDHKGDGKTAGEQQKVGSSTSIPPSHPTHTHSRPAASHQQVPFGEDDEQVIHVPVLSCFFVQPLFLISLSPSSPCLLVHLSCGFGRSHGVYDVLFPVVFILCHLLGYSLS